MLFRVFATALVAGLIAGLCAFGLQQVRIVPLIEVAETYESGAPAAGHQHEAAPATAAPSGHDHSGHDHGASAWEPEGLQRTALTLLADVLAGIGFAFLLAGAVALAETRGHQVDIRKGLLWGAAGFAVFTLAPSSGLPPELPGMQAADLALRQVWWACTAAATAGGLALIAFRREPLAWVLGVVLLAGPHLVGAPRHEGAAGVVPPELAAQFVTASMVTAALFWVVMGGAIGWLMQRLGREGGAKVAAA